MSRTRPFSWRAATVAVAAAALVLLAAPAPALAHDAVVASSPAAGSSNPTPPTEVTITFSAELLSGGASAVIQVTDAAGTVVSDGDPTVSGETVSQPLLPTQAVGTYAVLWRVVSSDGHPTSGEFSFDVSAAAQASPAPVVPAPTTPPATEAATPTPSASAEAGDPASSTEVPGVMEMFPLLLAAGVVVVIASVGALVLFAARARRRANREQP